MLVSLKLKSGPHERGRKKKRKKKEKILIFISLIKEKKIQNPQTMILNGRPYSSQRVFRQKGKFPFIVLDNRISLFVMYRIHMHSKTDVHNCFHCWDFF